ncbi:hypothetical protein HYU89_00370 [Candidatus Collierbacteria bacterium]|nr:hypothetical protein [Candidatus Collierbacteria bacterium]
MNENIEKMFVAAKERGSRLPTPAWGVLFGLAVALIAKNAEAAPGVASGITLSTDLAEWVPAALIEFLAFGGGAVQSFGLTRSKWYDRTVRAKNAQLRQQIQQGVEPEVIKKIAGLKATGKLRLEEGETIEELVARQVEANVEAQFAPHRIERVNPWVQAVREGARMAAGFGGPGLIVCDALIGLGTARLAVDAIYAIGGFAWMIGINEKERLLNDTLE